MIGEDVREQNISPNEINSEPPDDIIFEESAPVIMEISDVTNPSPDSFENMPKQDSDSSDFETEERIRIQNMSPEETMQYLKQSLNEINLFDNSGEDISDDSSDSPGDIGDLDDFDNIDWLSDNSEETEKPADLPAPHIPQASSQALLAAAEHDLATVEETPDKPLTVEPVWGDIYIKASRSLRELCESGKLTMPQIETELKGKLLDSAKQFAAVTKDESKIPKSLLPKITELKAAISNTDPYFQAGEDIAARAMFFMLYQMLSYADRIAQTPETKENLNDFFRRFGTAGITLSMLDVRV
ncbi:MAG: hypothetical protein ACI4JS_01510 [Oscillospiraceae bacterium]